MAGDVVELWFLKPEKPKWYQRLIQFRTMGRFPHVELVIGGVMYSSVAGEGGVRKKPATEPERYERVPIELEEGGAEAARQWFERHLHEVYDARGLLEIGTGRRASDERAWYCSEACVAALRAAGIWHWMDPSTSTPESVWYAAKSWHEAKYNKK